MIRSQIENINKNNQKGTNAESKILVRVMVYFMSCVEDFFTTAEGEILWASRAFPGSRENLLCYSYFR